MRAARTAWTVAGTRRGRSRLRQVIGFPGSPTTNLALHQSPDTLLEEERVPFGALDQRALERFEGGILSEEGAEKSLRAGGCQRIDAELGCSRVLAAPGMLVLGTIVDEKQEARGRQARHETIEERLRLRIDPVEILADQQQGAGPDSRGAGDA